MSVVNPGFEADLSSWSLSDPNASVTWTRDTSVTNAGSAGSSKFVQVDAGADDFIQQSPAATGGLTYTLSAWVNVTAFTAAAILNRGLYYIQLPGGSAGGVTITAATSGWVNLSLDITMASNTTSVSIRLYAPQGTTYWDDISLELPASQSSQGWIQFRSHAAFR